MSLSHDDLNEVLTTVEQIARQAGDVLREAYYQPRHVDHKGAVNLVTQTDRDAEALIVAALREHFPDTAILAEEGGVIDGKDNGQLWLIDPLDGTNNFAHGFPVFAVSIALREGADVLLGVVYDPLHDECFSAVRGQGATLNGEPIHVSGASDLQQGLLATGFPYDRQTADDNNSDALALFLRRAQGIRRAGAAAIDMVWVACGRLDGYWEMRLYPWDIAAGLLIVREAGGRVTDYQGNSDNAALLTGRAMVASNGLIHDEMLAVLGTLYDDIPAPRQEE